MARCASDHHKKDASAYIPQLLSASESRASSHKPVTTTIFTVTNRDTNPDTNRPYEYSYTPGAMVRTFNKLDSFFLGAQGKMREVEFVSGLVIGKVAVVIGLCLGAGTLTGAIVGRARSSDLLGLFRGRIKCPSKSQESSQ